MNLKRLFLIVAVGASTVGIAGQTVTGALADGGRPKAYSKQDGPRRGRMMDRMAQELKLTPSQKTRIQKIMDDSRARGHKIWEDKSLSNTQKRKKMSENREATHKRIDAVLTPDQRKKMNAMRAQMRNRRQQNGGRFHKGQFGGPHKKI
jgi:Spy/CpxP family protein refolding chaperone